LQHSSTLSGNQWGKIGTTKTKDAIGRAETDKGGKKGMKEKKTYTKEAERAATKRKQKGRRRERAFFLVKA